MSDEERKDDEVEVEGHRTRAGVAEEPATDDDDEVEAHIQSYPTARMD